MRDEVTGAVLPRRCDDVARDRPLKAQRVVAADRKSQVDHVRALHRTTCGAGVGEIRGEQVGPVICEPARIATHPAHLLPCVQQGPGHTAAHVAGHSDHDGAPHPRSPPQLVRQRILR